MSPPLLALPTLDSAESAIVLAFVEVNFVAGRCFLQHTKKTTTIIKVTPTNMPKTPPRMEPRSEELPSAAVDVDVGEDVDDET